MNFAEFVHKCNEALQNDPSLGVKEVFLQAPNDDGTAQPVGNIYGYEDVYKDGSDYTTNPPEDGNDEPSSPQGTSVVIIMATGSW